MNQNKKLQGKMFHESIDANQQNVKYVTRNSKQMHRNKLSELTQFLIPTHPQLQRHRLKFIKNHLKNSYIFRPTTIFRELQCPR